MFERETSDWTVVSKFEVKRRTIVLDGAGVNEGYQFGNGIAFLDAVIQM